MFAEVKRALARKFGPLPAWGWASLSAGGLVVYRHFRPGTSTAAATTAAATDTTAAAAQAAQPTSYQDYPTSGGGSSGGGGNGSGGGGTSYYNPGADTYPTGPAPADSNPPPPPPSDVVPPATTGDGAPAAPQARPRGSSQPLIPGALTPLQWGGETFTTKAEFDAWAKAHGTSVARELSAHPEASRIYGQLSGAPAKAPATATHTAAARPRTPVTPRRTTVKPAAKPAAARPRVAAAKPAPKKAPLKLSPQVKHGIDQGAPPRPKGKVTIRRSGTSRLV